MRKSRICVSKPHEEGEGCQNEEVNVEELKVTEVASDEVEHRHACELDHRVDFHVLECRDARD